MDDRASEDYNVGERSAKANTVKEETGEDRPNPSDDKVSFTEMKFRLISGIFV